MSEKTPPAAEQVEAIIRHYADNYRLMGRMGDGKIHGSSVAVDLEMNILKQVLAALAPAERASPVKHLNATGEFYERVKAWWLARGTSEFRGAAVKGDGYVNIWWEDASETGTYSVRIDDLYQAPAERAEAVPDDRPDKCACGCGGVAIAREVLNAAARSANFRDGVVAAANWLTADGSPRTSGDMVAALLPLPARAGALDAAGAETHTVDYLRLRFFRDLTDGQRLTIFDRAGLGNEAEEAGPTQAWQRSLFNRMIREGQERMIVEALKAALAAGDGSSE